ncbi:TPA: hypothetical protein ACKQFJ_002512 [Serratia marcescens]|uniref:hypothetical protein n=1 Tax=Serratia TaxID=613 RepID=UPI0011AB7F32|nr:MULTISPECIES: hypothetical protein [Serratia]MBL0904436.1 hypothetical protein [Serratia bockelmannii]HEI8671775.1 hypothetical protein [Serratia marcescens]
MNKRKNIPDSIQANVIHNSAGRCVICYGTRQFTDPRYPHTQIAHIDKNNENNQEDNLALLCISCHNLYDSTLRQGKNYKQENIKRWRDELYNDVIGKKLPAPMYNSLPYDVGSSISPRFSVDTIEKLKKFIGKAALITTALCSDGTYLSICIEHSKLDFIEDNFSNWIANELRCRTREVANLQDEFVSILWELSNSYTFLGSLRDVPPHIIPAGYYNNIGHAIKVSEYDCCGDLFNVIDVRDQWISSKLQRLATLFHELDDMAME